MTTTPATTTTTIRKVEIYCRTYNQEIRFHKDHRTKSGRWIPLNMDLTRHHDCPAKKQLQRQQQEQKPQQQPTTVMITDLSKQIAVIKAYSSYS